jgi:ankyrin repeat protein
MNDQMNDRMNEMKGRLDKRMKTIERALRIRRSLFGVVLVAVAQMAAPGRAQDAASDPGVQLAAAARAGQLAEVRDLIASGVDPSGADLQGTSALHWAAYREDIEMVRLLIDAGADVIAVNRYEYVPLYFAVGNGDAVMIRALLEAGADPNWVDPTGETLLMSVSRVGKVDAARALVEHGAAIDAGDTEYDQTALMMAVREGSTEIVGLLLDEGADPNAVTRVGPEPRWVLPNSQPGFSFGIGIVRGGSPPRGRRAPIAGGLAPLHYAARDGRLEAARLLLDAGAEIDRPNPDDITPLFMAIGSGHADVAHFLIERGADINASDWYGRTPLWSAVEARNQDIHNGTLEHMVDREPLVGLIETLLDRGADPNSRTTETFPIRNHVLPITSSLSWVDFIGQTPFITAALSGDLTVMRMLLDHGADPHIETLEGTSALMAAAGVNWVVAQTFDEGTEALLEAVTLCWELGLDVNDTNSMGVTPLMGAANRGSDDIIRFLVEKGARLDARDNEGRNALDWASGVFLATHAAVPKPSSMALIGALMAGAGIEVAASEGDQ